MWRNSRQEKGPYWCLFPFIFHVCLLTFALFFFQHLDEIKGNFDKATDEAAKRSAVAALTSFAATL
jgi:hypothetical protein